MSSAPTGEVFHLALIEPSHYDADGYPRRAWRTLCNRACLLALVSKCRRVRKHIGRTAGFREYADQALTSR